jgi:succinyl-CoA synthetase beta subunit
MNIHEYQAKQLLKKFGAATPNGVVALDPSQVIEAMEKLEPTPVYVVKAQIHAGGRGKAGGVKIVKSREEAIKEAKEMFGKTLVTHQTGPEGQVVRRVYIEAASNIKKEYYLGAVVDRAVNKVVIMVSPEGGVDIEEVASHSPEKIFKLSIDPLLGLMPFHVRKLGFWLGFEGNALKSFTKFMGSFYRSFIETDASQVEINPLVLTAEEEIIALDAKINFDDNALYKHPAILELKDENEEDPLETRAIQAGLSYIKMDGQIGCMVNGAGLAMATMDIIKLYGSEPANFLDVGGGATKERVTEAFKIILSDTNVKGILVNIFGGIMKCDIIASGIIAAAKDIGLTIPLVVRLAGTNFLEGKELLNKSGLKIVPADNLADAAQKIVDLVRN